MSTSESITTSVRGLRRELAVASVFGACIALLANPADPALTSLAIHPVWAIALIMAARYGTRGLLSIPALTVSLLSAEWLSGGTGAAALARLSRVGDLAVLIAAVCVAVVGAAHERRKVQLAERLAVAEDRARDAEAAVDELCEATLVLHDRCDRSETSLIFLADIAARMDSPNPTDAGQAALELAMTRTGANAGVVQLLDGAGRLRTLASRGSWSADSFRPPALFRDLTATAALDRATTVAAHEVADVRADDSDLAAPLVAPNGDVIGVLALRRLPRTALATTVREDLIAVARWAAGSLARIQRDAASIPHEAKPRESKPREANLRMVKPRESNLRMVKRDETKHAAR